MVILKVLNCCCDAGACLLPSVLWLRFGVWYREKLSWCGAAIVSRCRDFWKPLYCDYNCSCRRQFKTMIILKVLNCCYDAGACLLPFMLWLCCDFDIMETYLDMLLHMWLRCRGFWKPLYCRSNCGCRWQFKTIVILGVLSCCCGCLFVAFCVVVTLRFWYGEC